MAEVFVYDAVRTPRGRGKKDGSLHEVPAVRLGAKVLEAVRDRNGLETAEVDDIVFGCVDPVGEAGSVIPRASAFEAGLAGALCDETTRNRLRELGSSFDWAEVPEAELV